MSVIAFDFAKVRREREGFLIFLADAVRETINDDPVAVGALTAADLLDCESECQMADAESLFCSYRYAVAAANADFGAALNIDLYLNIAFLTPPTWKRLADIPPGVENKDIARARAIARWPAKAELFARKRDIDRAEAALIGLAGLKREGGR